MSSLLRLSGWAMRGMSSAPGLSRQSNELARNCSGCKIGSEPLHWRDMKSVGRGVREVKVSEGGQYRVFYVTRRKEGIVVLHAFEKKTKRTAKTDIEQGKQRLKMIRRIGI